ncbi:ATP-binding cassette domain-containing protein [Deinococcus detaillensis]|uniref:ATP-binding cassette domain-containing protein n=1 Tax=Deinococcus detaillensis TaxID=2592048 RepID=A0A553USH6_9DEIO|nr:ATP-binding cassette domain-containing protein [Deinococcus detaillensis]TSA83115.1 ATP-binding cassette domain-containing protein [Deinococcus detaillensis]
MTTAVSAVQPQTPARFAPPPTRRLSRETGVRGLLLFSTVLSVVGALLGVGAWLLLAQVIGGLAFGQTAGQSSGQALAVWWLPVTAGLLLLRAGLNALREAGNARRSAQIVGGLRQRASFKLLALGPSALSDLGEARSSVGLLESLPKLSAYYARWLPQASHSAAGLLVAGAALWWLDWRSALIVSLTVPLCLLFLVLVGWAAQDASTQAWTATTRLGARLSGSLRALPTLRAFGADAAQAQALAGEAETHRAAILKVLRAAFLSGFVLDFAATMSVALIAVTIGVRLFEGVWTFTPALAALLIVPEVFAPLRQLGTDRHASLDAEAPATELYALLDTPEVESGAAKVDGLPALTLRGVGLSLAGCPVLSGVNLSLPAGGRAALVGESGGGKTSLLRGLHKDLALVGSVKVNGAALAELDTAAWQARCAVVSQRPRFLAGTLLENLSADPERVQTVLNLVGLTVSPHTRITEDGHPLSGGERARLALARAALSDADLILLDEPTAHLDPLSEREVLSQLDVLFAGKTLLLVTHRHVPDGFAVYRVAGGRLEQQS